MGPGLALGTAAGPGFAGGDETTGAILSLSDSIGADEG
jgi:hypothetical protein